MCIELLFIFFSLSLQRLDLNLQGALGQPRKLLPGSCWWRRSWEWSGWRRSSSAWVPAVCWETLSNRLVVCSLQLVKNKSNLSKSAGLLLLQKWNVPLIHYEWQVCFQLSDYLSLSCHYRHRGLWCWGSWPWSRPCWQCKILQNLGSLCVYRALSNAWQCSLLHSQLWMSLTGPSCHRATTPSCGESPISSYVWVLLIDNFLHVDCFLRKKFLVGRKILTYLSMIYISGTGYQPQRMQCNLEHCSVIGNTKIWSFWSWLSCSLSPGEEVILPFTKKNIWGSLSCCCCWENMRYSSQSFPFPYLFSFEILTWFKKCSKNSLKMSG